MIKFSYYKNTGPDKDKEKVAQNVIDTIKKYIELPETIKVEFINMGASHYGETIVDINNPSLVRINLDLSTTDIVIPLVHELIHLEQMHTGRLSNSKFGYIIWEGKKYKVKPDIAYKDYMQLPWEQDVNSRLKPLLEVLL
mgnify:FL=1